MIILVRNINFIDLHSNICITVLLATEVGFNVTAIDVDEDSGLVQIFMFLSNPSSSTITFEVYGTDVIATGKLY